MRDFFKRLNPFLVFLPVLLIELVVLGKSVKNYQTLRYLSSPGRKIAQEYQVNSQMLVLGEKTSSQNSKILDFFSKGNSSFSPDLIEKILIVVIVSLFIILGIFFVF